MKKVSIKGVVLGSIVTLGLDTFATIILAIVFEKQVVKTGMTNQQVAEAMAGVSRGMDFLIASLVIGTLTTVVGGYIAARVAKKNFYLNSSIIGFIGIVLGIVFSGSSPVWLNVAAFITVIPAALAGGLIAKIQRPATLQPM